MNLHQVTHKTRSWFGYVQNCVTKQQSIYYTFTQFSSSKHCSIDKKRSWFKKLPVKKGHKKANKVAMAIYCNIYRSPCRILISLAITSKLFGWPPLRRDKLSKQQVHSDHRDRWQVYLLEDETGKRRDVCLLLWLLKSLSSYCYFSLIFWLCII